MAVPADHSSARRKRQIIQAKKRQLVPVASLELNERVPDMKKTTAAKAPRVSPLEDRPFAVLEEILDDAHHVRSRELAREHRSDVLPALDRLFGHLMADGALGVEGGERVHISSIERV